MNREEQILALWRATAAQDAQAMAQYFTPDAVILWPNSSERFRLEGYLQANCEYPGQWEGQVERVSADGSVSVARVWNPEGEVFRAVSFYQWQGDRIARLEEYWGDEAPAPAWRRELGVASALSAEDAQLPEQGLSPALLGRCGFYCGVCPTYVSGGCPGCGAAHVPGDCFTRDCTGKQGLSHCTLCSRFPCGELLRREKATVLDKDWLRWKRRE